jgi:hypothetical protein
LNREWAEAGRLHGGIVLRVPQSVPVGDQIRALARICSELTSDEIRGGLEFIRSWLD